MKVVFKLFLLLSVFVLAFGCEEKNQAETGPAIAVPSERKVVVEDKSALSMAFFEVVNQRGALGDSCKQAIISRLHSKIAVPDKEGIATFESKEAIPEGTSFPALYRFQSLGKVKILRHRNNRKVQLKLLPDNDKGQKVIALKVFINEGNRWRPGLNPGEFRFPSDDALSKGTETISEEDLVTGICNVLVRCLYK